MAFYTVKATSLELPVRPRTFAYRSIDIPIRKRRHACPHLARAHELGAVETSPLPLFGTTVGRALKWFHTSSLIIDSVSYSLVRPLVPETTMRDENTAACGGVMDRTR